MQNDIGKENWNFSKKFLNQVLAFGLLLLLLAPDAPKHLQTAAESPQMMPCRSTDKQSPVRSLVGLDVEIRGVGEVLLGWNWCCRGAQLYGISYALL